VSFGAGAVRLLEHTKFTQRHGGASFLILVELKITIDSGVRNLLFDQDDRMLATSRIIVPLGGFGQNLSVVRFKAPTKLKPCVFIRFRTLPSLSFPKPGLRLREARNQCPFTSCATALDKREF
jgi:hypothetical protein